MNSRSARFFLVAICIVVFAGTLSQRGGATGQGTDVTIDKDDQTVSIDCNRNALTGSGDDNNITLKGECTRLTVSGDDNKIKAATVNQVSVSGDDNTISVETVAKITTSGSDNTITWKKGVGDTRPEVSTSGVDNKIKQGNFCLSG